MVPNCRGSRVKWSSPVQVHKWSSRADGTEATRTFYSRWQRTVWPPNRPNIHVCLSGLFLSLQTTSTVFPVGKWKIQIGYFLGRNPWHSRRMILSWPAHLLYDARAPVTRDPTEKMQREAISKFVCSMERNFTWAINFPFPFKVYFIKCFKRLGRNITI